MKLWGLRRLVETEVTRKDTGDAGKKAKGAEIVVGGVGVLHECVEVVQKNETRRCCWKQDTKKQECRG